VLILNVLQTRALVPDGCCVDPQLTSHLRIDEREREAGGRH
jgi:hypothetical protein